MTPLEPSAKWAWCSALLLSAVGLWGWSIDPGHPARWLFVACFVPLFWGYVEFAQGGDLRRERATLMHWHRAVFAWSGFVMASHIGMESWLAARRHRRATLLRAERISDYGHPLAGTRQGKPWS
jgi:hypothetical protein